MPASFNMLGSGLLPQSLPQQTPVPLQTMQPRIDSGIDRTIQFTDRAVSFMTPGEPQHCDDPNSSMVSNTSARMSQSSPLAALLKKLVVSLLRDAGWSSPSEDQVHRLWQYGARLLSSHLSPAAVVRDEVHCGSMIKKHLMRIDPSAEKAMAFSQLAVRWSRQTVFDSSQRWAVLYFLYQLALNTFDQQTVWTSVIEEPQTPLPDFTRHKTPTSQYRQSASLPENNVVANVNERREDLGKDTVNANHEQLWKQFVNLMDDRYSVSETSLLRDMVFVLQGTDGQYIRYDGKVTHSFVLQPKLKLPLPVRHLVLQMSECGVLHRRIHSFIQQHQDSTTAGLVMQSFVHALRQTLVDYGRLVSVIEGHVQKVDSCELENKKTVGLAGMGRDLTLRRLFTWLQIPRSKLRLMAVLVECCQGQKGGQLISSIYSYLVHGDPMVQKFVQGLLTVVCQPFYQIISKWIYQGELDDPFEEFFVARSSQQATAQSSWQSSYWMRQEMIPLFIHSALANKIFLIGKSLNFIQFSCLDRDFVSSRQQTQNHTAFSVSNLNELEASIDVAYRTTSQHLLTLLHDKFNLTAHLTALRRYLLLGQGDFIQQLMDPLAAALSKPAHLLMRHNLTAVLDGAVRASNAQWESEDILKRLDVRLLEPSPGDCGWDVFSLDYHVSAPLDTVLTANVMQRYLQLFHFLWRLRRVDYTLAQAWQRQMTSVRLFRNLKEFNADFHSSQLQLAQMMHCVGQLQFHVLQVLASSWSELAAFLESREGDLDQLMDAHESYLQKLMTHCMLSSGATVGSSALTAVHSPSMLPMWMRLFDTVLRVDAAYAQLYEMAANVKERKQRNEDEALQRRLQGQWSNSNVLDNTSHQREQSELLQLSDLRLHLVQVTQQFNTELRLLLAALQSHADVNLRLLSFRLDFNEFYQVQQSQE